MAKKIAKETSTLEGLLLGCLMHEKMSGYDISKYATKHLTHVYTTPSRSQIYEELKKLEEKGSVVAEKYEQQYRPAKSIYALTKNGKDIFLAWLSQSMSDTIFKSPFLIQMYFSHHGDMTTLKKLVLERIQEAEKVLTILGKRCDDFPDDTQEHHIERLTLRHTYMRLESEYNWLNEVLDTLPCDEEKPRKRKKSVTV